MTASRSCSCSRARRAGILPDEHLSMAAGSQAVIFPSRRRHRISNGVYTPCRLLWMVFQPREKARGSARLFLDSEIEALFDVADRQEAPIDLPEACRRNLNDLCNRLTDERLLIGSAPMMAEVRSKVYASVTQLWEVCASGSHPSSQSRLVRDAARAAARRRGRGLPRKGREHRGRGAPARLRQEPPLQPVLARSRHGAQRLPPAHPHQALLRAAGEIRRRDHDDRHSTAVSAARNISAACSRNMSA